MPNAFEKAVRQASAKADASAIAAALGALVAERLRVAVARPVATARPMPSTTPTLPRAALNRRSTGRRRGRMQRYTPTAKVDISRIGTFRHYMLRVIREHTDTWSAEQAHARCENSKFAKNRLDFGWAAAEGFITFD